MVELSRTVRLCITGDPPPPPAEGPNGYGGVPVMRGLGRFYELRVTCAGEPDPRTGYLINIKEIDRAVRAGALPILVRSCESAPYLPAPLMSDLLGAIEHSIPDIVRSIRLSITPTYHMETDVNDRQRVTIRQRFDFAAAHRLHVPELSEQENDEIFGKCNNSSGHGHNYQIEPAVRVDASSTGFTLSTLERLTDETIIERFDHKHLNLDTDEFADENGLNPTVENIARVCYELLEQAIAERTGDDAALDSVTVWETDRTCATYPATASP